VWGKLPRRASGAGSSAGIVYNALSGLEAALWDLVGTAYGVAIHSVLGGRFRDSVRHVRRLATPVRRWSRFFTRERSRVAGAYPGGGGSKGTAAQDGMPALTGC
jgi:L-alanine-DL-glutamate epimerase-like enolase superfamily enzyme